MTTVPSPASGRLPQHMQALRLPSGVCPPHPGKSGKRTQSLCFIWEGPGEGEGKGIRMAPPSNTQAVLFPQRGSYWRNSKFLTPLSIPPGSVTVGRLFLSES